MFAWQFAKMQHAAETNGLTKFVSMQNQYSPIIREEEQEMFPLLSDQGVGSLPWSPLAGGLVARTWGENNTDRAKTSTAVDFNGNPLWLDTDQNIAGTRTSCGPDFQLLLKLSMERYGLPVGEIRAVAAEAIHTGSLDYLDIAPHDIAKTTEEEEFKGRTLLSVFTDLPRGNVKLGASGKILSARKAASALDAGCDFALIGRAAILQPDFPQRVQANHDHHSPARPVSQSHLENAGLSPAFINRMREGWDWFVASETVEPPPNDPMLRPGAPGLY